MTGRLWTCPGPTRASVYVHFTSPQHARAIAASRTLRGSLALAEQCPFAVLAGGWWKPSVQLCSRSQPREAKTAAVLFTTDLLPLVAGPFEVRWARLVLPLRSAGVVPADRGRLLLDGRLRPAMREASGRVWCARHPGCCPGVTSVDQGPTGAVR